MKNLDAKIFTRVASAKKHKVPTIFAGMPQERHSLLPTDKVKTTHRKQQQLMDVNIPPDLLHGP